jgi:hypothetical protein
MMTPFKFHKTRKLLIDASVDVSQNIIFASDVISGQKFGKKFSFIPIAQKRVLCQSLESDNTNLYEVLSTGTPVKLYFDLEMEGDELTDEINVTKLWLFLKWVIIEIMSVYNIQLENKDFILLDCCRNSKLSYHLVIQNKVYFESAEACGNLIKYFKNRFSNPTTDEEITVFEQLTWFYGGTEKRYIFDVLPYSKNQCFRLVNQSKIGKPYILKKTNEAVKTEDCFVRLYGEIGDRILLNTSILILKEQEQKKLAKPKPNPKTIHKIRRNLLMTLRSGI